MPESRSDKRKERYRELRALRFSPEVARRYRDRSGKEISLLIAREQRRISRKSESARSADESFRLRRIQDRQRFESPSQLQSRLDARRERWEKFSDYSKSGLWPADLRAMAREWNERAGKESPDDSYGYRRVYYFFVERLPDERAEIFAQRNDSNAKFLRNEPLVSGRPNLRALLRSPNQQRKSA